MMGKIQRDLSDGFQYRIPDQMTISIIDGFEVVDIQFKQPITLTGMLMTLIKRLEFGIERPEIFQPSHAIAHRFLLKLIVFPSQPNQHARIPIGHHGQND
jgi:hypothetical protein